MKHRLIPAAAVAAAATALCAGLLNMPAHAAGSSRHVVISSSPTWATASADKGALAGNSVINARVYLASRDQAGLDSYAVSVSTPGNALFHHYLTPAQATARFGSKPGSAARIAAWLKSEGLAVTGTSPHFVAFRGTADKVGAAFGTSIHGYTVNGTTRHSPAGNVTVPASVAGDVLTVMGLTTDVKMQPTRVSDSKSTSVAAKPTLTNSTTAKSNVVKTSSAAKPIACSAYEGEKMATKYPKAYGKTQPYAVCGYEPKQLRGAYGVTDSGYTGKGVTVVVVDAFALPTMAKDLKTWNKNRGEQQFKKGQYNEYVPAGTGYNDGWAGEEALDIEAVHGMAPDAKINYVAGKTNSGQDLIDAIQLVVDKKLGDAVNNSYEGGTDGGTSQGAIDVYENIFKMGAAEGIGFYFSSGDGGGAGGTLYPSVDPFATSVGGSAIGIGKKDNYLYETGWETDYTYISKNGKDWDPAPPGTFASGAGGGTSVKFKQPKWQKGVVPKKYSQAHGHTPMRVSPDIGAVGDPTTGFLEGYSSQVNGKWVYAEGRIGGTSLSAPLIVGMVADAEQASGSSLGFGNPSFYALYDSKALNDPAGDPLGNGDMWAHVRTVVLNGVTTPALPTAGQCADGALACVTGYDTTTGVGTPTASFYKALGMLK